MVGTTISCQNFPGQSNPKGWTRAPREGWDLLVVGNTTHRLRFSNPHTWSTRASKGNKV